MKNLLKYSSIVFISLFIMSSCIDEDFEDSSTVGINDDPILLNVLNSESESNGDDLSILLQLLDENGLTGALTSKRTQDQLTVFAPTNNAFEIFASELGYNSLEDMLSADAADFEAAIFDVFGVETNLLEILENHVSNANLSLAQIENGSFRKIGTLSEVNIPVNRENGLVLNNDPNLEVTRTSANLNGTVHVVSRIVIPVKFIPIIIFNFGDEQTDCEAVLADWRVENVVFGGGDPWGCTRFGFEGQAIQANGFDNGPQNLESWIISPSLESNSGVLNTLKFKYGSSFGSEPPEIWVINEEDYDPAATFDSEDWTKLDFSFPAPADGFSDESVLIPSEFHSGAYRFAYRYISSTSPTRVTIDNIQIGEE